MYRCPLCLKLLDGEQRLERFCTKHEQADRRIPEQANIFNCDRPNLRREIFCGECNESDEETINEGVFLRHVGCSAENPFWKESSASVVIPGKDDSATVPFPLDFGTGETKQVAVRHWLLRTLRQLPKTEREMWFPLMMLRATGERRRFRRFGKLIELVGPQRSGKTILALLSANNQGWNLNGASADVHLNNYIFSRINKEGTASLNRYIETLHFWSLLDSNDKNGLFLPQGTTGDGHLKVCFIKPGSDFSSPALEDYPSKEYVRQRGSYYRKTLWESFKNFFGSDTNYPFWYSVIFYDSSGEDIETETYKPEVSSVDSVAIVVNAVDIFSEKPVLELPPISLPPPGSGGSATLIPVHEPISDANKSSLRVAWQRIQRGVERRKQCFLVITQLDRIRRRIGEEDWKQVEHIANNFDADKNFSQTKALVKKWLEQNTTDDNAEDLAKHLNRFDKIFFVWTENLPTNFVPERQIKMPASHGITKFICACLNIPWQKICQTKK